jgi:superfamily II DNA or RNA helicase
MKAQSILTIKGLKFNKKELDENHLLKIHKDLTVSPTTLQSLATDENSFKLYDETKDFITVPRFYGEKNFGLSSNSELLEPSADLVFNGALREYQKEIVDKCFNHLKTNGGGLLSVPCGYGKTLMAIYIATMLKTKVLVVVHKTFLLDQWIDNINEYTNGKVGIIQQNKVIVEDKNFVICMIQSLSKRDYDIDILKNFGFVIFDECHHVSSKMFSKALAKTSAKYMLGLSATPYRKDGLTKVIHWHLGDIIYQIKFKSNNQVCVRTINYFSVDKTFVAKERSIYDKSQNKRKIFPDTTGMISNLIEIKSRNKLIVKIIEYLRKNPDRKILVLSERIKHLEKLKKKIDKLIKADIDNKIIEIDECITGFYHGQQKPALNNWVGENADIIFGGINMMSEGVNIPRLNTVIFCTPRRDVVQSAGRILRKVLVDNDIRPLIIDIVDCLSSFSNQYNEREKYYKKCNYDIQKYYVIDKKFVSSNKFSKKFEVDNATKKDKCTLQILLDTEPVLLNFDKTENIINDDSESDDKQNESDSECENIETNKKITSMFKK